jgi:hypothetical protein
VEKKFPFSQNYFHWGWKFEKYLFDPWPDISIGPNPDSFTLPAIVRPEFIHPQSEQAILILWSFPHFL